MEKLAKSIGGFGAFDHVDLVGVAATGLPGEEERGGYRLRRFGRVEIGWPRALRKAVATLDWSRRVYRALQGEKITYVNSHSLAVLPLAALLKHRHGSRLIYDTHELETEVSTARGPVRWLYKLLERFFIGSADQVVVVSESIADWYEQEYGIARPVVVRNVPEVSGARPEANPGLWRERFGIPADHLVFIYQGGLFKGRRIEQLLRVFAEAKPDRHIVFMGYGQLQPEVELAAARHRNIHFAPAVKPDEVLRHTAGADVGLVGVENICLSYYYSLPNKLFEFLLAGIPALMPAYPEMVRLTEGSGSGWVVGEDDAQWRQAINALTHEQVAAGKLAARRTGESLSWQTEASQLVEIYTRRGCRNLPPL